MVIEGSEMRTPVKYQLAIHQVVLWEAQHLIPGVEVEPIWLLLQEEIAKLGTVQRRAAETEGRSTFLARNWSESVLD